MSRKYQGLIVLNTKSLEGTVDELVTAVSKELEAEGAKLEKISQLGRRQFAYNSRHLEAGHYVQLHLPRRAGHRLQNPGPPPPQRPRPPPALPAPRLIENCSKEQFLILLIRSPSPDFLIAMANLNKVMLIGNLTRDPELRYTPKRHRRCGHLAGDQPRLEQRTEPETGRNHLRGRHPVGPPGGTRPAIPHQGPRRLHRRPPANGYLGRQGNRQKAQQTQGHRRKPPVPARRPRRRWRRRWRRSLGAPPAKLTSSPATTLRPPTRCHRRSGRTSSRKRTTSRSDSSREDDKIPKRDCSRGPAFFCPTVTPIRKSNFMWQTGFRKPLEHRGSRPGNPKIKPRMSPVKVLQIPRALGGVNICVHPRNPNWFRKSESLPTSAI